MLEHKAPVVFNTTFQPNLDAYKQAIRFEYLDDVQNQAIEMFSSAKSLLKPKVALIEMFTSDYNQQHGVTSLKINEISFVGKALGVFDGVQRVIPYIATCGDGMEAFDTSSMDMLAPYWLDVLKSQALDSARSALASYCKTTLGIAKPLSLSPGSGNVDIWPIEELGKIFELFGRSVERVGVVLTDSFLMLPNKSIAGVMFEKDGVEYESCAHCSRLNCPMRKTKFKCSL